jgi:hypothetical protein
MLPRAYCPTTGQSQGQTRGRIALRCTTIIRTAACVAVLAPASAMAVVPYLGASVVQTDLRVTDYLKPSLDGFQIHGGLQLGRHFALEAAYADLGSERISECGTNACIPESGHLRYAPRQMEVAALGILPLGQKVELFAKAGVARTRTHVRYTPWSGTPTESTSSDSGEIFGAGVAMRLSRMSSIRVQLDRHDVSQGDFTALRIGGSWSFGR